MQELDYLEILVSLSLVREAVLEPITVLMVSVYSMLYSYLPGLKSFNYGSIISNWNGVSQTLVTKQHYRILGLVQNGLTHLDKTQMPHPLRLFRF